VLFGIYGNSYTISTKSDICIYTHIIHNVATLVGQKKEKKLGQWWIPRAKEIFPRVILGTCAVGSATLG
jgi:hypothetical protein